MPLVFLHQEWRRRPYEIGGLAEAAGARQASDCAKDWDHIRDLDDQEKFLVMCVGAWKLILLRTAGRAANDARSMRRQGGHVATVSDGNSVASPPPIPVLCGGVGWRRRDKQQQHERHPLSTDRPSKFPSETGPPGSQAIGHHHTPSPTNTVLDPRPPAGKTAERFPSETCRASIGGEHARTRTHWCAPHPRRVPTRFPSETTLSAPSRDHGFRWKPPHISCLPPTLFEAAAEGGGDGHGAVIDGNECAHH
jgi:hypothetical protein